MSTPLIPTDWRFKQGDKVRTKMPERTDHHTEEELQKLRNTLNKTYTIERRADEYPQSGWYLMVEKDQDEMFIWMHDSILTLYVPEPEPVCTCDIQVLMARGCQCGCPI